ncbi:MAG: hypothetical protein HUK24_03915 [Sphaerochaetaceae bacterium]|nr:hypothetical protein [Sphaerochaetaceae bacterium]
MKKTVALLLVLITSLTFLFATDTYASCISDLTDLLQSALGKSTTVAFLSLESDSEAFSSRFISDVERNLINRDCKVLDRSNTETVVKELEFQTSGLVDDKQAVSIGHMLGAKMVIVGSAVNQVGSLHLDIKLIDMETTLTVRNAVYDLKYDTNLRNIIKGDTNNIGTQNFEFGLRVGAGFAFNKASTDMVGTGVTPQEKSFIAKNAALSAFYKLGNFKFGVEGLFFLDNGMEISGIGTTMTIKYSTLDIPVLVSWNAILEPISVDVFAGPYISFPLSYATVDNGIGSATVRTTGRVFGVVGGINIGLPVGPGKAVLDGRYMNDFGSFIVPEFGDSEMIYRKTFVVSAGYMFSL